MTLSRHRLRAGVVLAGLLSGCGDDPPVTPPITGPAAGPPRVETIQPESRIRFHDVAAESGVEFTYRNGEEAGRYSILESLGGGVGLLDYDCDGHLDIVVPGGGQFLQQSLTGLPTALFRNIGTMNFVDVSLPAAIANSRAYSHGIAVTDFDNDGFPDILVTGYGSLQLFNNLGDGTFSEVSQSSGLDDDMWSSSAAFGDFNGDGNVDLYVAHYVNWSFEHDPQCRGDTPDGREICPPRQFEPLPDVLYLATGDGTFVNATEEWGLVAGGKGLGVVVGDIDLDQDLDVYVGNDTVPNFLYVNEGDGFRESGVRSGTGYNESGRADGSMGVDLGDADGDGLPDLWAANYESESFALYHNEGSAFFSHSSASRGVSAVGALYVGWGTCFFDPDLDGDQDVFVANGHVIRHPKSAPLRQHPLIFENQTSGRLVNVGRSAGEYTASQHMGRGLATGDLDNDGDPDVVVSHTNEPIAVLENRSGPARHWIRLRLIGRTSSRQPVGAIVHVKIRDGVELTRQIRSGGSYASSSDARLLIGLGNATEIDAISIGWPSGAEQVIGSPALDMSHTVIEPDTSG